MQQQQCDTKERVHRRSEEHTSELQSRFDLVCRSRDLYSFPTRRSSDLQTKGFIHGGANVVLAETAASVGASRLIAEDEITFGMEINANHLRTVRNGLIYATATMRHKGKSTQEIGRAHV